MKRPSYEMQKIKLADCKPHADAEAYSASTEDRAALGNSIEETGVLSPIAVIADEDGSPGTARPTWFVIDGIGRMNALIAAGETETEAQVFDLGDLSVAEFVVCKNAMMRKVTTGTRVMAYLKCHEREVLAAAKEECFRSRMGSKWRNGWKAAVSHETAASDKGWSAKDIAGRIGVSKQDVLAGIELLKETVGSGERGMGNGERPRYEQNGLGDARRDADKKMEGGGVRQGEQGGRQGGRGLHLDSHPHREEPSWHVAELADGTDGHARDHHRGVPQGARMAAGGFPGGDRGEDWPRRSAALPEEAVIIQPQRTQRAQSLCDLCVLCGPKKGLTRWKPQRKDRRRLAR